MQSQESRQSESPDMAILSSLKHDDIIDCLLQFIEEKNWHIANDSGCVLNFDQKRWLDDVTNHGLDAFDTPDPNAVVDWRNPQQIAFALLNLSQAGKKLNAIKFLEDGINDYIGTNLPEFKSHPDYKVYPNCESFKYKNKTYTMTSTNQPLNNTLNIPVIKPPVDPNKCFNEDLLAQCIEQSEPILPLLKGFGSLVYPQPQLIWLEEIHQLEEIVGKDGTVRPRGFQTRADQDIDHEIVDQISSDIIKKKWNPRLLQGAVFALPKNYQGQSFSTRGVERRYGIANLTHRIKSAIAAGEDYITAWVVDIPLNKLRKWAVSIANQQQYAFNVTTDNDIVQSIKDEMNDVNSDLSQRISNAPEDQRRGLMETEVDSYNVHFKRRDRLIRTLEREDVYQVERKRHDSESMELFVQEHTEWASCKDKNIDYLTNQGVKVYTAIDQGANALSIARKIAVNVCSDNPTSMIVVGANDNAKTAKIDKSNRNEKRKNLRKDVIAALRLQYEAGKKLFEDHTAPGITWTSLPEFGDEEGNKLIYIDEL